MTAYDKTISDTYRSCEMAFFVVAGMYWECALSRMADHDLSYTAAQTADSDVMAVGSFMILALTSV